jgi:hypothetical protein
MTPIDIIPQALTPLQNCWSLETVVSCIVLVLINLLLLQYCGLKGIIADFILIASINLMS